MEKIDNLMVFVECKLFIFNMGYCVMVYLGCLKGYCIICEVIEDLCIYV